MKRRTLVAGGMRGLVGGGGVHDVEVPDLRRVFAQWPTGVALVTTLAGRVRHGMTAGSVTGVSLDPPLASVCLDTRLRTHRLIRDSGRFAVSFLGRDQVHLGRRFAGLEPEPVDRFAGVDWAIAATGAPVLGDCVAWLDCSVEHTYPGGDHTIFVGRVRACGTPRPVPPLLYHSRDWGQLADRLPKRIELADVGLAQRLATRGVADRDVARLTAALGDAGIRVRLRQAARPARSAAGPHAGDFGAALVNAAVSAPVATAGQVARAAARGAGVVEVTVHGRGTSPRPDVDLPGITEAARAGGLGVALRVEDAFAPATRTLLRSTLALAARLGCREVCLDEGVYPASPLTVRDLALDVLSRAGSVGVRMGLREQHGLGLANALTAMKSGIHLFDTTLGGIDGRLSAEDLLYLAHRLDIPGPADRAAVLETAADLERVWGTELPARTRRTVC